MHSKLVYLKVDKGARIVYLSASGFSLKACSLVSQLWQIRSFGHASAQGPNVIHALQFGQGAFALTTSIAPLNDL